MAGKKTPSKTTARTAAPNGQQTLFHFYRKQPKVQDEEKHASPIGLEVIASRSSDTSGSQEVTGKHKDTDTDISAFVSKGQRMAPGMGHAEDLEGLRPRSSPIKTLLREKQPFNRKPEKISDGLVQSPARVTKPSRKKAYSVFDKYHAPPRTSQDVSDDESTPVGGHSATSFKTSPSRKQSKKTHGQGVLFSDVIDLTEPQGDGDLTTLPERHPIIAVDCELPALTLLSGSQDAPIDLSSSPLAKTQPAKVLHPIFARPTTERGGDKDPTTPHLISPTLQKMGLPWPDAQNQHNSGPQSFFCAFVSSNLRFLNNAEVTRPPLSECHVAGVRSHALTTAEREATLSSLPNAHRRHPGISRLLDETLGIKTAAVVDDAELWSQKWRPRRAAEVLGNENNALYLKAWLRALAIRPDDKTQATADITSVHKDSRGTKRPAVIRAITKGRTRKKRKVTPDDDYNLEWIVNGEEEFPENDSDPDVNSHVNRSSTGTLEINELPLFARHGDVKNTTICNDHEASQYPELSTLTNTILLAGPPGSGKTSTIYACAEELGWEVFEVYPGIGKRSGGNISSLVGDVGKNHLVGRRGTGGAYSKRNPNWSGFGFLAGEGEKEDVAHAGNEKQAIRQSAILLDEVDVLFKEDANFWPAVVNIIKSSHRPIFMTCNDISLIPQADLPLQTCLHFQSCPSPLAVSFLQSVCLVEGYFVSRKQLENMYSKTYALISCDEPDEPSVPYPSQPPPCSDLRYTMNNLQFWCSRVPDSASRGGATEQSEHLATTTAPDINTSSRTEVLADWAHALGMPCGGPPNEESSPEYDIYRIGKHTDCASYIDGYLEQHPSDILEALAIDRYETSGDDEIGHTLLSKPVVNGRSPGLAFYNRDTDIAREALDVSRHVFEASGAGPRARGSLRGRERGATRHLDSRSLVRARMATQTGAASFLDDVITLPGPLLPRAAAVLEYIPYVRQMVLTDDALETEAAAETQDGPGAHETRRRGRLTRSRWQKEPYPRYLTVSAEGLEAARNMLLGCR